MARIRIFEKLSLTPRPVRVIVRDLVKRYVRPRRSCFSLLAPRLTATDRPWKHHPKVAPSRWMGGMGCHRVSLVIDAMVAVAVCQSVRFNTSQLVPTSQPQRRSHRLSYRRVLMPLKFIHRLGA